MLCTYKLSYGNFGFFTCLAYHATLCCLDKAGLKDAYRNSVEVRCMLRSPVVCTNLSTVCTVQLYTGLDWTGLQYRQQWTVYLHCD
jgi:hypothetical protein